MIQNRIRELFYKFSTIGQASCNFFEINPIHPTFREPAARLYGPPPKTNISPLHQQVKENKARARQNMWIDSMLTKQTGRKQLAEKRLVHNILQDVTKQLPEGYRFDWFDEFYESRRVKKIDDDYTDSIVAIINKFKVKSEPELIRFFRLALADLKKDEVRDRLRGAIVKSAVLEAAKLKNQQLNSKVPVDSKLKFITNLEEVASKKAEPVLDEELLDNESFYEALRELDAKIQQAENNLGIQQRYSLREELFSPYHAKPNTLPQENIPLDADINFDRRGSFLYGIPVFNTRKQAQDYVIDQRIRRLFFLKKSEKKDEAAAAQVKDEIAQAISNAKLLQNQLLIEKIARDYHLEKEIPQNDIENIYKEVDLLLHSLKIRANNTLSKQETDDKLRKIKEQSLYRHSHELLWENLQVNQVYEPSLTDETANIPITDEEKFTLKHEGSVQTSIPVSPNHELELSLAHVPFNLYRHSEFRVFGITNPKRNVYEEMLNAFHPVVDVNESKFPRFQFESFRPRRPVPPAAERVERQQYYAGGKRKKAHALCRLRKGTGVIKVNRKNIRDYFDDTFDRAICLKPMLVVGETDNWDVDFFVYGSGYNAQADACGLALARALYKYTPQYKRYLRKVGLVTQDPRFKERKHSGKYKARKAYPYVRR